MGEITLQGTTVFLRALEPEDLDLVLAVENDERHWQLSATLTPFSRFTIKKYLEEVHRDIFEVKQLRLAICKKENEEAVGMVDIFDYDPKNRRAGLGIIIFGELERGKGFGFEALQLITRYSFTHLEMHQLYANILEENTPSIKLFEKAGFTRVGLKKDWIRFRGSYKNELLYQLIHNDVH